MIIACKGCLKEIKYNRSLKTLESSNFPGGPARPHGCICYWHKNTNLGSISSNTQVCGLFKGFSMYSGQENNDDFVLLFKLERR